MPQRLTGAANVTDFKPVNPRGKSPAEIQAMILEATQATHECVHRIEADTKQAIGGLSQEIGAIKATQDIDSGRITTLAKMFGAERVEKGEKKPVGHGIGTWPWWKAALAGLGLLGAAVPAIQWLAPVVKAALIAAYGQVFP